MKPGTEGRTGGYALNRRSGGRCPSVPTRFPASDYRPWPERESLPLVEWTEGEIDSYFDGLIAFELMGGGVGQ